MAIKITKEQEKELIKGCLAGDPNAQKHFVDVHKNLIYKKIIDTCRERDFNLDEDAKRETYQNVFLKIMKEDLLKRFNFKNRLTTWIGNIAFSVTIDYMRKEIRRNSKRIISLHKKTSEDTTLEEIIPDDQPSQSYVLCDKEKYTVFLKAFNALNEEEKHIIDRFFKHVSIACIAKELGISEAAVNMRKKRAIEKLKLKLKKYVS